MECGSTFRRPCRSNRLIAIQNKFALPDPSRRSIPGGLVIEKLNQAGGIPLKVYLYRGRSRMELAKPRNIADSENGDLFRNPHSGLKQGLQAAGSKIAVAGTEYRSAEIHPLPELFPHIGEPVAAGRKNVNLFLADGSPFSSIQST